MRNVVAAGGCTLPARGRHVRLIEPELFVDPSRRLMPYDRIQALPVDHLMGTPPAQLVSVVLPASHEDVSGFVGALRSAGSVSTLWSLAP